MKQILLFYVVTVGLLVTQIIVPQNAISSESGVCFSVTMDKKPQSNGYYASNHKSVNISSLSACREYFQNKRNWSKPWAPDIVYFIEGAHWNGWDSTPEFTRGHKLIMIKGSEGNSAVQDSKRKALN